MSGEIPKTVEIAATLAGHELVLTGTDGDGSSSGNYRRTAKGTFKSVAEGSVVAGWTIAGTRSWAASIFLDAIV